MASFDEAPEIFVGLGVLFVVVPAGHVQRADTGFAPALGEIVEIDARAVGAIEERPEAFALEGRLHPEIAESLQQVGKAFVAFFARRRGDPQHSAHAAMQSHDHRCVVPALDGENRRVLGHIEDREFRVAIPR